MLSLVANQMGRVRENLAGRTEETWRPPACADLGLLRRFFDLQAGSVFRDVRASLASAKGTLLDVGCGAQPYRPLVPAHVQYRAIDTAAAGKDFGYFAPDTTYYSGQQWPVRDGAVDVVLCTETLEHVLDPQQFLREAARCLSPGGRLILTVPFAARWHFIPNDYWRFTPSCLKSLLQSAGFDEIEVYARGNAVTVACYKDMAIVISLVIPQGRRSIKTIAGQALGILLLPFFAVCALAGNLSLGGGGDDCLGYTVFARKR